MEDYFYAIRPGLTEHAVARTGSGPPKVRGGHGQARAQNTDWLPALRWILRVVYAIYLRLTGK